MSTDTTTTTTGAIDLTPTWGEWVRIYRRFAESGEARACRALRDDLARLGAMATALNELLQGGELSEAQRELVAEVIAHELAKAKR